MVVVARTIFVPTWNAEVAKENPQAIQGGFRWEFDSSMGCDVITVKGRLIETPEGIRRVPMKSISIVHDHSPFRSLKDGLYQEEIAVEGVYVWCSGRVETYMRDGSPLQSIRATIEGDYLAQLNAWFDALVAGEKAGYCDNPAPLPEEPLNQLTMSMLMSAYEHYVRTRRAASREQLVEFCDTLFRFFPPIEGYPALGGIDREEVERFLTLLLKEEGMDIFAAEQVAIFMTKHGLSRKQ
jgi:hypothetical protein